MKTKPLYLLLVFTLLISLFISPFQALADGKYPLRITEQSMIVFPVDESTIQIIQIIDFKNNGSKRETELPIYLPKGYLDLQLRDGLTEENMQKTKKGITDITGLEPGKEKRITISYKMPILDSTSIWAIEQSYVTERLLVIIQPGVLSFNASDLVTQSDLFKMNGQEFRRFTRVDLHPKTPWTLSFRLLVDPTTGNDPTQEQNVDAGSDEGSANFTDDGYKIIGQEGIGYGKAAFTIAIIILALTVALIGLKRDLKKTTGKSTRINRKWLLLEKEDLLQEIVQLEKDYQSNLIGNSTYEKEKERIRNQLIQISTELGQENVG